MIWLQESSLDSTANALHVLLVVLEVDLVPPEIFFHAFGGHIFRTGSK
jgi:hypothetical protein